MRPAMQGRPPGNPATKGTASVRPATGQAPAARAANRVLLTVASAALAAGVMASTASTVTASVTKSATSTGAPLQGTPPFFAGIVSAKTGGAFTDAVKIFSSSSGAVAGTVAAPESQQFAGLARLGADQKFVAASFDRNECVTHLWTFGIDAAGTPSALTPLAALPQVTGAGEEMTSSADGTALVFQVAACNAVHLQTEFIHLPTGQITRWDTPGGTGSLSLTADGSVLGFALAQDFTDPGSPTQIWTMPTDAPDGDLLSQAHQVPGLGANAERAAQSPAGDQLWIEALSPDGLDPVTLSLITTGTGELVRPVAPLSDANNQAFPVLALDHAGQHMLAYGGNPGPGHADVEEIDLSSGQTHTLTITNPVIDGAITTFAW